MESCALTLTAWFFFFLFYLYRKIIDSCLLYCACLQAEAVGREISIRAKVEQNDFSLTGKYKISLIALFSFPLIIKSPSLQDISLYLFLTSNGGEVCYQKLSDSLQNRAKLYLVSTKYI